MHRIELVYELDANPVERFWSNILKCLPETLREPDTEVHFGDEKLRLSEVEHTINKKQKTGFRVAIGSLAIDLTFVASKNHTLLQLENCDPQGCWWGAWVAVLTSISGFVQGWVVDVDYNHWQNAFDPLQYKAKGRSLKGLSMKSNGLPPPLEKQIVDTSQNPGRRTLRKGYVEAIGGNMWLSDRFWELTGKDKAVLDSCTAFEIVAAGEGVRHIKASTDVFDETSDVAEQNRMRELLYG